MARICFNVKCKQVSLRMRAAACTATHTLEQPARISVEPEQLDQPTHEHAKGVKGGGVDLEIKM